MCRIIETVRQGALPVVVLHGPLLDGVHEVLFYIRLLFLHRSEQRVEERGISFAIVQRPLSNLLLGFLIGSVLA